MSISIPRQSVAGVASLTMAAAFLVAAFAGPAHAADNTAPVVTEPTSAGTESVTTITTEAPATTPPFVSSPDVTLTYTCEQHSKAPGRQVSWAIVDHSPRAVWCRSRPDGPIPTQRAFEARSLGSLSGQAWEDRNVPLLGRAQGDVT